MSNIKYLLTRYSLYFWMIVVLVILFATVFSVTNNAVYQETYYAHNIEYTSIEEIPDLVDNLESELESIEQSNAFYDELEKLIQEEILLYNYLYENEIEYEDAAEINGIHEQSFDKISMSRSILGIMLSAFLILIVIINVELFSLEFSNGSYKFVYGRNVDRLQIVLKKILASAFVTVLMIIIFTGTTILIINPIVDKFDYVLLFVGNEVVSMTIFTYLFLSFLSALYIILFYYLVVLSLTLLFRKVLLVLISIFSFFILFQVLLPFVDSDIAQSMTYVPLFTLDLGVSLRTLISIISLKMVAAVSLLIYSMYHFKKCNI